jgi:8-amino-7-oxononanoate synthase
LHVQRPLDDAIEERLAELEAHGLRRTLLSLSSGAPGRAVLDGRSYLDFGSNDYLGLAQLPIDWRGLEGLSTGARASRLVTGNLQPHEEAEAELAAHVRRPAALLFTSGYATNVGTIPALVGPGDHIFSDALNHASLIDGCRLSRASVHVFAHNDLADLERRLAQAPTSGSRLIVSEGVFSMEGDQAPLTELASLARAHGAWLMVDEAHSLGVLGPEGRGVCAAEGVEPEVLVGTLGKAFGAMGAFVAGSERLRELLFHRARSLVFSTGVSPVLAAIVSRRTPQVQAADAERERQRVLCERLAAGLTEHGIEVRGTGPIVTAVFGDPQAATRGEARLREAGVLARAIRPPTVPEGTSRIRLVPTAAHDEADVDRVLEALT